MSCRDGSAPGFASASLFRHRPLTEELAFDRIPFMRSTPSSNNNGIHPPAFNNLLYACILMLSLPAAGCVSSATWTAGRALDDVRKGNLKDFQSQLTDKGRPALGTQQEMDAIRQRLAQFTHVSLGPALLISSRQGDQGAGQIGDIRRTYTVTVTGSARKGAPIQAIYTLFLKCLISYDLYHHDAVSDTCSTTIDADGVPWTNCSGGSAAYDSVDLGESCLISKIEEAPATSAE